MAQRGTQVVRDGISKGLQFLIGSFELGGPLFDSVLEIIIEVANFTLVCFSLRDVAESYHSTMHGAVLASQRARAGLDPATLDDLRIAQKYLRGAGFSTNRAHQRKLIGGVG